MNDDQLIFEGIPTFYHKTNLFDILIKLEVLDKDWKWENAWFQMLIEDQYTYWKLVDMFDLLVKLKVMKRRPLFVVEDMYPDGQLRIRVEWR